MERFDAVELEVITVETEDVITESNTNTPTNPGTITLPPV